MSLRFSIPNALALQAELDSAHLHVRLIQGSNSPVSEQLPMILLTAFGPFGATPSAAAAPSPNTSAQTLDALYNYVARMKSTQMLPFNFSAFVSATDWCAPWRFAAIARQLRPTVIINLGQSAAASAATASLPILESAALNLIGGKRSAYDQVGNLNLAPVVQPLDSDDTLEGQIDGQTLVAAQQTLSWNTVLERAGFQLTPPRRSNAYICNMTAWVIARAVAGCPQKIQSQSATKAASDIGAIGPIDGVKSHGFMHLPATTNPLTINSYVDFCYKVMSRLIAEIEVYPGSAGGMPHDFKD